MQPPTFCEKSISSDHSPPDRATPCRPPENRPVPQESLQKTRYATSRNPRNGAAILAVPRLNLCSPSGGDGRSLHVKRYWHEMSMAVMLHCPPTRCHNVYTPKKSPSPCIVSNSAQ